MIRVSKKLKYLFDEIPHMYVDDEVRVDKLCFMSFKRDEIPKEITEDDDWELVHLDGDIENCAVDNLELIVFDDEDYTVKLYSELRTLKKELVDKNNKIRTLSSDCNVKDIKVENMYKQVLYEQNRVKELNKEIKSKEKEIRRLFTLLEARS